MFFIVSSLILSNQFTSPVQAHKAEGEFSLLTYNVAGLWDPVSQSSPATNTILISPKLNNYDIVLAQEDFNYHSDLIEKVNHPYLSSHSGIMGFGDGLSRVSMFPFTHFTRKEWNDCYGVFDSGTDCLTPKGFSFARHEVSDGVFVDIYNLHADAGGSQNDKDVRKKNFQQLLSKLNEWSTGNAIIVAGDFNSKYKYEGEVRQFVDAGFSDAWADIENGGIIPGIGESGDRIDKILYRSGDFIQLSVKDYAVPNDDFLDSAGKQLSDHQPVSAIFEYHAEEAVEELTLIASTTSNGGPQPGQKHRSSNNFSTVNIPPGTEKLYWEIVNNSNADSISFRVKEDVPVWTDPIIFNSLKNGSYTGVVKNDSLYIADPSSTGGNSFTVNVYAVK
ncbi:hypothetical protein VQL36_18200 [Chengkuizengella sp. SCS-71B]|uniref:hypothetical protein n=1 Tax=Chengkuizengella sp. SCS-71B TaxID=3115290 RepID=UPI0032C23657